MANDFESSVRSTTLPQDNERQLGKAELEILHRISSHHRDAVLASDTCGCFYCNSIFPASEVEDWTIEPGFGAVTALCPRCEIDAVLPSSAVEAAGFELSLGVLAQMGRCWFDLT